MITELRGGKFKSGFVGAFIAKLSPASSWVQQGLFNLPIRTVAAAVFGGLAARATGGSFRDGAMAAAFAHLFNAEVSDPEYFDPRKIGPRPTLKGFATFNSKFFTIVSVASGYGAGFAVVRLGYMGTSLQASNMLRGLSMTSAASGGSANVLTMYSTNNADLDMLNSGRFGLEFATAVAAPTAKGMMVIPLGVMEVTTATFDASLGIASEQVP